MIECNSTFYSLRNILARMTRSLAVGRNPLFSLVSNLSSRRNSMLFARIYKALWQTEGVVDDAEAALVKVQAVWFLRRS
jgi:hypothetical protein